MVNTIYDGWSVLYIYTTMMVNILQWYDCYPKDRVHNDIHIGF
jgi:hypothetical protein